MACWLPSLCQTPFFREGFEIAAYGREVKVDEEAAWPLGDEALVDQRKSSCGGAEMGVWLLGDELLADQDGSASGWVGDVVGREADCFILS